MLYSGRQFNFKFLVLLILVFTGCRASEKLLLSTWASSGESVFDAPALEPESLPAKEDFIWAGTVSHHLLVGEYIDDWFKVISENRNVKTFFIICPSHYGYSVHPWSIADVRWDAGAYGKVDCNSEIVNTIVKNLGITQESGVFIPEHGMNTLIPYVKKYFPDSKIVPIAVHGEPPLDQALAEKLYTALKPYFDPKGKKDNFLVLSTDFAHHGNYEGTVFKDNRTRTFFDAPLSGTWICCGCDNRPGVYILSKLMSEKTEARVQYHTNSYDVSGKDENDITSYFFAFFVN